ncbi:MAG: lipid-A-disaccharide synthase [Bdellovibrionales bacterium]|nr:lipid-A-disaccharide synthase [Bdellovibrionales bacterium]
MAQSTNDKSEILIVAGEASSALYAQRLLEYWQRNNQEIKAYGVGSIAMEQLGFDRIGRSEEMAVVGLTEVLKHYSAIKKVFNDIIEQTKIRKPKVILLLDYPDFNLRLAKKLKPLGIPIVYYISPQVWAWRKSRVHDIRKLVDKMLVLLPFEKDFYKGFDVDVEFVGHPLLDELKSELFNEEARQVERSRYGVLPGETWIGLMPGSRNSEIKHHLVSQLQAAQIIYSQNKQLKFALLVAPTFSKEDIQKVLPQYDIPLTIVQADPLKMVSLVDVVICASGTATLIVGLLKKPMVIMYKMNALSAWFAKLIVKGTQYFGLINLVLGKKVVPELFQSQASAENISAEVLKYIEDEKYKAAVIEKLSHAHLLLGSRGATVRVAEILKPMLF